MSKMADVDDRLFTQAFTQSGGDLPVYRPYGQRGDGFGDVLRGLSRWFLPLLTKGVGTFFGEVSRGQDEGKSFGDAAKGALMPTAGAVLSGASSAFTSRQRGSGRRRPKRKAVAHRRVYKGRRKRASATGKKSQHSHKKLKFNF